MKEKYWWPAQSRTALIFWASATGNNRKGLSSNYGRFRWCRATGLHKSFKTNCKWTVRGSLCEKRKGDKSGGRWEENIPQKKCYE